MSKYLKDIRCLDCPAILKKSLTGRCHSCSARFSLAQPERMAASVIATTGRVVSQETRKAISASLQGVRHPAERVAKNSMGHIGKPSPRLGMKTGKPAWNSTGLTKVEYKLQWNALNPNKGQEYTATRRARKADAFIEAIDRQVVFARDAGLCGICGIRIPPSISWPHLMSFDIDHVQPLARGGEHSYANTQAAHHGCNLQKGAG